jgi:2-polyprenyl-6-methoxyphenol hydroxylase-like FAD-dependent oxidoreductase
VQTDSRVDWSPTRQRAEDIGVDAVVTRTHAIVIGAGIAGLFAARVLSETHDRVTVVDRDALPGDGVARSRVPQGQHIHAVLMQGVLVIRELFPGLIEDLVAGGAPMGDILTQARTYAGAYRMAPAHSGLSAVCVSRPYLEYRIRDRLAALPNVEFMAGRTVVGLTVSPGDMAITGVRTADDGLRGLEMLTGDLVVDASGRGSQTPHWLEELGFPVPSEDRVHIDVAYSSCTFAMPADVIDRALGILVIGTPANPRGGGLIDLGNNNWLVSLSGYHGAHPPVTPDAFIDFARQLPVPDIYEALLQATPTANPVRFRVPDVVRRRYDRLARFPKGLVVLGDAVANFNPVYGQGMSVAAQEALVLRRRWQEHGDEGFDRLRKDIARTGAVAWTMSVNSDLRMPWITGRRTATVRFGNAYLARLQRVAQHDPQVALAFMRVANLIDAPARMLRPSTAWRVLIGTLHPRRAASSMLTPLGPAVGR